MLILDFFHSIRTFYAWVFPLNMMVTASMLAGSDCGTPATAGGLDSADLRWDLCLYSAGRGNCVPICHNSEALMFVAICGWFAEAALLSCAVGTAARLIWEKRRNKF